MKLIVITKPTFFVEEDKILVNLFEEGLENLHLCKPGSSPMYSERLLTLLGEDLAGKITVHNHFYLKEEYKLKGIHIDDEKHVCIADAFARLHEVLLCHDNLFCAGHPLQEVRERVG